MAKNLFLDPILACLALMWTPQKFLAGFTSASSYKLFQAIILYNLKVINEPNLRKWQKKTNFGPDFDPFWPKFSPPKFFSWVLPLLDVKHCCKLSLYAISRKTDESNLKNGKKPSFGPDFGLFGPNLGP